MDLLIASRDELTRRQLESLVSDLGHRATCVKDSTELLKLCLREDVDMVLLDIDLGPLSGVELIGLLKEVNDAMLLVPLVEDNENGLEFAVRSLGIFYYMLRPHSAEELVDVLDSARKLLEPSAALCS